VDDASGLEPGAELGKYRLDGCIGRGGMGEVWAAHDPDLDRKVALKVLRPSAASSDDGQVRLLREGRAMARLRHPNVITVYEATSANGRDLIAMELIDGKSLAGWLAEHRAPAAIVSAMLAAGRGLAAAHRAGMVHRDFKPHNVLVDHDGRVVVTDFGLARAIDPTGGVDGSGGDGAAPTRPGPAAAAAANATATAPGRHPAHPERSPAAGGAESKDAAAAADVGSAETIAPEAAPVSRPAKDATPATRSRSRQLDSDRAALHSPLTRTGALLGTPAYMAPEQLAGGEADARTDQFAYCVTAWEALAGCRPFQGENLSELHAAVDAGKPVGGEKLPARLRVILARGLAHDPLQRWPSMDALLTALDRAWRRPRRVAIGAIIAVGIAAIVITVIVQAKRGGSAAIGACPSFAEDFAPAQTKEIRELVRGLGQKGESGKRVVAYLDRWKASWRDVHTATCSRPKDPEFNARRSCLDSFRDNLVQMLQISRDVSPAVLGSTDGIAVLPMPEVCFDHPRAVVPVAPTEPEIRAEIVRINAALLPYRVGRDRPPEQTLAGIDPLIEAARRTHHDPLIADALMIRGDAVIRTDPRAACAAHDEAAIVAERAGADAMRIDAMLGQLECVQRIPERQHETDRLIERVRGLIARLGDTARGAHLDQMQAWITGSAGNWDEAIALAAASREAWAALDAPVNGSRAAVVEAEYRLLRGTGDDLHRAEQILRASLDAVPEEADRPVERLRRTLGQVLWRRGRMEEAVTLLVEHALPPPDGTIDVIVRVVDSEGKPASGAEILAAIDPIGDPVRLIRTEVRNTISVRADANGEAAFAAPAGSVIVARKNDELAAAETPARPGDVRLALRGAAIVEGAVTIPTGAAPGDPRAARRTPPTGTITMRVGTRTWSLVAPVDDKGIWRLAALPGRAQVSVETASALDDAQAGQATIELRPGRQTVPLALPRPVSLRAIGRPAADALIVAVPGTHAVKTWRAMTALIEASPTMTVGFPTRPEVTATGDVRIGDMVIDMAAPGAGPITVCALPGAGSPAWTPVAAITPGPAATPPVCVAATAVDGVVTTVVVATGR
jgi:serine/threonine protein kinase